MVQLFLASALISGFLSFNWSAESAPEILQTPLGDRVTVAGLPSSGHPGEPLFPQVPLTAVLPEGAVADSVAIVDSNTFPVSYNCNPMPAQAGVPISRSGEFHVTSANPEAYSTAVCVSAKLVGQGTLMGYPVADIVLTPLSWNPDTRDLYWAGSVQLQLFYHIGDAGSRIPVRGETGTAAARQVVAASVVNPSDIPVVSHSRSDALPWGEYLIIADDAIASAFEPLAELKTQKGIPAKIVNMSYITGNYTGVDNAQKLRFFLADIYRNSPPTYILLAGDTPGVPHRNCFATAEGCTGDPASDLYYQDMNDTAPGVDAWDLDGDGTWGELNGQDNMDYHPDYILGRASVETVSEAGIFVNKVLMWEDTPDTPEWYTSMGFTTEILWSSPHCPGSAGKEKVDTLYTPATWTITKLYQETGTQSYDATIAMLNKGMQFVNHAGHGSGESVSIGVGSLDTSEFMGLTNVTQNGRPTIWNTIACLSGSFDTGTCLAEAWIRSPGGGGFCIMNTRFGWGEPAEPGNQWSELVDQEFFANFFVDNMYHLGTAYMMAKDDFVALIPSDTHYDWIAKSNTLFGDPELPMYTTVPGEMEIQAIQLCAGDQSLTVSVSSGGSPLENARVCLLQGNWNNPNTYAVGTTDASGNVTITWAEQMPAVPAAARLTVWARDKVLLTGMHTVENMGISEENQAAYPVLSLSSANPVTGNLSVNWSIPGSTTGEISIVDLAGRTVSRRSLEGSRGVFSWQSEHNPAGIYFVRLTTAVGDIAKTRLVVVH
jgi:hypothetical protein